MAASRRTAMTKLLFRTALIELMQEKPFHKITVKEICEQADLNRTTFYLHYTDQTQLLKDIVSKLEMDTAEHFSSVTGTGDDIDILCKHLEYIKDNAKIYKTLMSSNLDYETKTKIFKNMLDDMKSKLPVLANRIENPYAYKFITFGCGSVISKWIDNGFDLETHELAKLLFNLCKKAYEAQIDE